MSETINIPIKDEDGWVEINHTGLITASKSVEFVVSDTPPERKLIGHHLKTFGQFEFSESSSTLYVRGTATIIVTSGDAFNANGEPAPKGLYTGSRAITVQSYLEANAKKGTQHEMSLLIEDMSLNTLNDTILITGSKPLTLKERYASYTGAGVTLDIFEDALYTSLGDEVKQFNLNRINAVESESVFYSSPVITSDGIKVFPSEHLIGNESRQGEGSTGSRLDRERILKPETTYLFRITSLDASQDVYIFNSWYEGDTDLPL